MVIILIVIFLGLENAHLSHENNQWNLSIYLMK